MKENTATRLLALFSGSSGSSLHYTGRSFSGWLTLIFCWVLLPATAFWCVRESDLNPFMVHTMFGASVIFIHLILAIAQSGSMKDANAEKLKGRTGRIVVSILVMILSVYFYASYILPEKQIDTSTAAHSFTLNSTELSEAYNLDETAYRKKYDGEVVLLSGKVMSKGMDFSEGEFLALEPAPGSPTDVNCYFNPDRQNDLSRINEGDLVTVRGVVHGRFLKNCFIVTENQGSRP
jgi:hypothetical protein